MKALRYVRVDAVLWRLYRESVSGDYGYMIGQFMLPLHFSMGFLGATK